MMENYEKAASGLLVPVKSNIVARGRYFGQIIRGGHFDDDGVWHRGDQIIDEFMDENLVTNEGLNHILSAVFNAGTQITAWYVGVFEGNYTPLATDTASGFATAATESTAYANATRPAWTEAAPSSQTITNAASRASFVFNATKTIYGAFLVSTNTKSGTSGTLMSASRFSSSKNVDSNDELLITYAFTASSV